MLAILENDFENMEPWNDSSANSNHGENSSFPTAVLGLL